MFLPRSMFQLTAASLMLFAFVVLFISSHSGSETFEHSVGSRYMRFDRSRVPPPEFHSAQVKVDIDEPASDPIWDTQNRTLGFQKIYAISMPHRTDKRDYLALMALVSHIDIEFVDGVNGSLMHPHAIPAFWKGSGGDGEHGCWRAHLNIYQHMVQKGIQSALIIEDDADWDILLKSQMLNFARGTRALQKSTLPLHSPYGDSWNLLPLGHIGVGNKPDKDQQYYVTYDDPTVITEARRRYNRKPNIKAEKLQGNHTRIVMEVNKMTGTAAYGISLRGASRMLYDQAILPDAQAIDLAIAVICRHDNIWNQAFCLGAYPTMFGLFRGIGVVDRDSDRKSTNSNPTTGDDLSAFNKPPAKNLRKKPESIFTVFSVALNLHKLLLGETKFQTADPTEDLLPEIDISTYQFPRGEVVHVMPGEYTVHRPKEGE